MLRPSSLRENRGSATHPAHAGSAEYPCAPPSRLGGWMNPHKYAMNRAITTSEASHP